MNYLLVNEIKNFINDFSTNDKINNFILLILSLYLETIIKFIISYFKQFIKINNNYHIIYYTINENFYNNIIIGKTRKIYLDNDNIFFSNIFSYTDTLSKSSRSTQETINKDYFKISNELIICRHLYKYGDVMAIEYFFLLKDKNQPFDIIENIIKNFINKNIIKNNEITNFIYEFKYETSWDYRRSIFSNYKRDISISNSAKLLLDDIEYYEKNIKIYNEYINSKRAYMLYGIPGSGKSHLIYYIANKYNLNIYNITFREKNLYCEDYIKIIKEAPDDQILLLDDIDKKLFYQNKENNKKPKMDYYTFLNLLDKELIKFKFVFILTNEIPDNMDKALIRPGRIDKIIKFDYLTQKEEENMIKEFSEITKTTITNMEIEKFLFRTKDWKMSLAFLSTSLINVLISGITENILEHIKQD